MNPIKILVINFGSTSTKLLIMRIRSARFGTVYPSVDKIKECKSVNDQYAFRKEAILDFMKEHNLNLVNWFCYDTWWPDGKNRWRNLSYQ